MPYKKTGSILPVQGIDVSTPPEWLDAGVSPDCQNMRVYRNIIKKRPGTSIRGMGFGEEIMAGREFETGTGDIFNVAIGLTKIKVWNGSPGNWLDKTGTDLSGGTARPVCTAVPLLSGQRILVLTNGVDNIRKFDGINNSSDLGGTPPKCKYVQEYKDYLILANITDDGGNAYPMKVQWCDNGAGPETWTGGNAGSNNLMEGGDEIKGIGLIGNYVAVHKESAIYIGYLVSTSTVIQFDRTNAAAGTVCHATIQRLPGGGQIYLAADGLRIFDGDKAPLIDSPLIDEIREGLNPAYMHKCWSVIFREFDEYWVGVPIGSQTTGETVYKYNYRTGMVYKDTRPYITAAWEYTKVESSTWDDIGTAWDDYTDAWDSRELLSMTKLILFGDSNGALTRINSATFDDNSVAVDAYWTSKDFQNDEIGRLCEWLEQEVFAKGSTVQVYYSTDEGITWTLIDTKTLTSAYPADSAPILLYFDVVSSRIRFKFRNAVSEEWFALKQFITSYVDREMRAA